jgi:hypothetical protein
VNEERTRRVGKNEALYRLVNEQIEGINEAFGTITDDFAVVCECGDLECHEQITVTRDVYERVRADPATFILKPGHQIEDVEDVIAATDHYVVVTKKAGTPQDLASRTDPRT